MLEIFFIIILLISFIGIGVMLYTKVPVLVKLEIKEKSSLNQRRRILKFFSLNRFLHKILSKFKVLTLRTENKTSTLLTKLRQKSIKEKTKFSDDYWKKLKRRK